MKNIVLIFSLVITVSSCSQSEEINDNDMENSIYGTWQLTKRTANNPNGTPNDWENLSNGFILKFENDLKFESNESTICQNSLNEGVFSLSTAENSTKDVVEITINNCDSNPNGSFIRAFYYSFNDNDLILIPKDPACDEGCAFKYEKIE